MRPNVAAVLLAIAIALAAIGTPTSAPAQPMADTLTWGEDRDMRTLDPRVTQSRHETQVIMQVFDSLMFMGNDGKIYPWLAESWQFAPDGLSITMKLRRGVRFHDGTPFNAEAVKFTFDSIVDPKLGSQAAIDLLGPYKSTEVLDPYTVRINWTRRYGPALINFTTANLGIVSPAAVKRLGDDAFSRAPVGSGMYKFVEWTPRVQIVLERNEQYNWAPTVFKHKGAPRIRRLVSRFILDDSTRVAALEKREIDVAESVPAIEVRRFRGSQNFDVMLGEVTGFPETLMFNLRKAPTDDIRVRKAIMHAVNRPQLVEQLFFGLKKPVYSILAPKTPGHWPEAEKLYPYDQAKARQLLEESGWKAGPDGVRAKGGQRLEVFYRALVHPEVATAVQAAVKDVGIQMSVESVTKAKQDEQILANDYHILSLSWSAVEPSLLSIVFHSRNIPRPGKFGFNWNQIASPELDRMLAQSDSTTDPARRREILVAIQKFVLDRALAFPIHPNLQATGFHRSVRDLTFAANWYNVWFYDASISR
jgi:peptide/nickel transport system substrate-binding protein